MNKKFKNYKLKFNEPYELTIQKLKTDSSTGLQPIVSSAINEIALELACESIVKIMPPDVEWIKGEMGYYTKNKKKMKEYFVEKAIEEILK